MKGNVSHKAETGQRGILLILGFYIVIIKLHEGKGGKRRMMEEAGETRTNVEVMLQV